MIRSWKNVFEQINKETILGTNYTQRQTKTFFLIFLKMAAEGIWEFHCLLIFVQYCMHFQIKLNFE